MIKTHYYNLNDFYLITSLPSGCLSAMWWVKTSHNQPLALYKSDNVYTSANILFIIGGEYQAQFHKPLNYIKQHLKEQKAWDRTRFYYLSNTVDLYRKLLDVHDGSTTFVECLDNEIQKSLPDEAFENLYIPGERYIRGLEKDNMRYTYY
jgi:hypothetical protein